MLYHVVVLAAGGVPNITPDFNNPAMPLIIKIGALVMALLALYAAFQFFAGGFQILSSFSGHHEGGVGRGAARMAIAAIFLGFVFLGTSLVNTWANFFGS